MTRCRPMALLAALLILGMSATPDAIAQKATVEGHARAEEDGAPVQFALVRLVRADSIPLPSDSPAEGMTNAGGTVRVDFADIPVAGGTLRMPVGGAFAMRPSRKNPTKRTEGKIAFTYSGFEEIPPR